MTCQLYNSSGFSRKWVSSVFPKSPNGTHNHFAVLLICLSQTHHNSHHRKQHTQNGFSRQNFSRHLKCNTELLFLPFCHICCCPTLHNNAEIDPIQIAPLFFGGKAFQADRKSKWKALVKPWEEKEFS